MLLNKFGFYFYVWFLLMIIRNLNFSSVFGLIWLPCFIALQSIPHTGALRNFFLLLGLMHLFFLARKNKGAMDFPGRSAEFWFLLALLCWFVIHSFFIAPFPLIALNNFFDEWFKLLFLVMLGVWMVVRFRTCNSLQWVSFAIFLGFFIHVISTLSYQLWSLFHYGHVSLMNSFLGNYGYATPFVTSAISILIADGILRMRGKRWLPLSNKIFFIFMVLSLLALFFLNAKAGFLVVLFLFVFASFLIVFLLNSIRWFILFIGISFVVATFSMVWSNRWDGGFQSLELAVKADINEQVKDLGYIPPGEEGSFYLRAIWGRIGIDGISKYPWGMGFGPDAFGRYVVELGGKPGAISSHSGWIDFTLANGFFGFFLLFSLLIILIYKGIKSYFLGTSNGIVLSFFVMGFLLRSLLDGHLYGSRLVIFAFIAAILWSMTVLNYEIDESI